MKERTFDYKGHIFEPIGNILGGYLVKSRCLDFSKIYDLGIDVVDYKEFYKIAKRNHASCDVYKINNSDDYYMLSGGSDKGKFVKTNNNMYKTLKLCSDYQRWYK